MCKFWQIRNKRTDRHIVATVVEMSISHANKVLRDYWRSNESWRIERFTFIFSESQVFCNFKLYSIKVQELKSFRCMCICAQACVCDNLCFRACDCVYGRACLHACMTLSRKSAFPLSPFVWMAAKVISHGRKGTESALRHNFTRNVMQFLFKWKVVYVLRVNTQAIHCACGITLHVNLGCNWLASAIIMPALKVTYLNGSQPFSIQNPRPIKNRGPLHMIRHPTCFRYNDVKSYCFICSKCMTVLIWCMYTLVTSLA